MSNPVWSDKRKAEAARLWNDGWSAGQIAARLGVSRNAVVGIAARNRDQFRAKMGPGSRGGVPRGAKRLSPVAQVPARTKPTARSVGFLPPVIAARPKPARAEGDIGSRGGQAAPSPFEETEGAAKLDLDRFRVTGQVPVPFGLLGRGQCKFPLAAFAASSGPDMPCCGAPSLDARPYCAAHAAVSAGRA